MERRKSRGRRKIEIQKMENEDDRYATFSKRRVGLLKKASELCTLCDVDMGIIISSPTGKPFSFFHPTVESVLNRYYNYREPSNNSSQIYENYVRNKVNALNQTLDEISEKLEFETKRAQRLTEIEEKRTVKGWWEAPVQELNREQVQELKSMLENFINQAKNRMEKLRIDEASSSSSMQLQGNFLKTVYPPGFFPSSNASLHPQGNSPHTLHSGFFPFANPKASAGASMHPQPQGNFPDTVQPGFLPNASVFLQENFLNTLHPGFFPNASAGASMLPQGNFPNTTVHPDFFDPNGSAGAGADAASVFLQGSFSNTVHPGFFPNASASASMQPQGNFPNTVYPGFIQNASASASMHPQGNFPNIVHPDLFANENVDADPNLDFPSTVHPDIFPNENASPDPNADFPSTTYPGFCPNQNADPNESAGASTSSSGAGQVGASYCNPLFRGRN